MFERPAPIAATMADLAEVDRRWAAIVERVIASREQVQVTSGLSMAVWLAGTTRLPRAERTAILVAADVLPRLPGVRARFGAGAVSWPVVARICTRASRLSADDLGVVDERMTTAIDRLSGDCTADAVLDVFDELLAQLRASRERDRERTLERGEFLALQPFLLGLQKTTADLLTRLVGGRMHLTAHAARQLADAGCDFRLVVHDPDGATVGVGTQTHLPHDWLRDAVLAFNATCTCPGCRLPARECDLDHADEWRDDGSTDAGNLGPAHRSRHSQKTRRQWTVTRTADQSTTWTHRLTGLSVTQPSLWAIKALATGTHPADRPPDTAAEARGSYRTRRRAA